MEQVLDLLKRAEERINDFGRVGSYSLDKVDTRLKDFQSSLEYIGKSQNGLGGIFKSFDELNRRSNEFLGKSYRGIIDGMKHEVKAFEQEADKILNKIKDAESQMEAFKSRRKTMSEQEYQEGVASRDREIGTLTSQGAAVASAKADLQRDIMMSQPVHAGLHNFMSRYGMGQYATVGGAIGAGIYAAGVPAMVSQAMMATGNYGMQMGFTRDADAYIAQARLNRSAAGQAMNFDPTTYMLQSAGGGIEKPGMESWSMWAKSRGQFMWENPYLRALAAGSGTFLGLTSATLGIGAAPAAWAASGAASAAFASAPNRSLTEIEAMNRGELRNRDLEMYGILGRGAGGQLQRESSELMLMQRIYGIGGTHNLSMSLADMGISGDRANPMINAMISQGLLPNNVGDMAGANSLMNRASLTDSVQKAILRMAALNGGTLSANTTRAMGLFSGAGLVGVQDISARSALGDYASGLMSNRGAGQDLGTVGAAVAANVAQNTGGFNKVEGVGQGIMNFEAQSRLMGGGSSALDTILISKLRQLGVTNAVAIDGFIKLDVRNPRTQQQIAAYTGKSIDEVRRLLGEAAGAYTNMFETVVGKDQMDKFNRATGGDMMTLLTTGVKAFDNTTAGGGTFSSGLRSSLTGGGTGRGESVGLGLESMADKQNAAAAQQQIMIDDTMRRVLEGTGKTVTDEITKAVLKGFEVTAEEVRKAGDKIVSQQGKPSSSGTVESQGSEASRMKEYLGPKVGR